MTDNPDWKSAEEIAAVLEEALVPTAKVEHDVRLPVIGKRRSRQCDVVITYGEHPRQTIAIVEVQKRRRKPEINTFHGWVQKMREVGAQHLICVSALGYPQSIIDEVQTQHGPTVRLLTLEELEHPSIGGLVAVSPFLIHRKPLFSFESIGKADLETDLADIDNLKAVETSINIRDKVFSLDDSPERYSLIDLTDQVVKLRSEFFFQQRLTEPASYALDVMLGSVSQDLWFHQGEERQKIHRLPLRIRVEHQITEIPMKFHAYRQEFIDGTLAWIISAKGLVEGDSEISVQLVFRPDQQGFLRLTDVHHQGGDQLNLIVFSDKDSAKKSCDISKGIEKG